MTCMINLEVTPGIPGVPGPRGWSPVFAVVDDGDRRVLQVVDWTGSGGTKPTAGYYVGNGGLVPSKATGVNIRGPVDDDAVVAALAAQAAAEAARAAAEEVAAAIPALPAITANTMLVDNAAGDEREAKTFAEVVELLSLGKNIRHYGGSGSSDNAAAIAAMAADVGFVRFPYGNSPINSDVTIDVPVFFADGAYVTVASTKTVTVTEVVNSPKQHVFRGSGSVVLSNDSDSGENARQLHVSWFGAFPGKSTDQAPAIQKAFDAVGTGRESVIDFDVGNYLISSAMTATRGAWVRGSGTRRTVFLVTANGFDVFATGATACRFTDIQFENKSPLTLRTSGAYIRISHDFCEVANIFHHPADNGIFVDNGGTNAKISNIEGVYGSVPSVGSRMILVRASGARIKGVYCRYSVNGPTSIIEVGTGASGTVITPLIDDVEWNSPSTGVLIHGDSVTVARGQLTSINGRGSNGSPAQAVKFLTSGTGSVFGFTLNGVCISANTVAGISFEQNSSGTIKEISVDDVFDAGTTGNGIEFIRTAGSLTNIRIGGGVNCRTRATPFYYSGGSTDICVDPQARANANVGECYYFGSVAHDAAVSVDLKRSVFSGVIIVTAGTANYGTFAIRAASSPAIQPITVSANMNSVATALAGTTGPAAKVTVGVDANGIVYVENRLGSAQNISINVLAV